ncbi:uncharacterized protein LOC120908507 isoform X1 [Anopheles arabiensis]|uniref:uncharacterized protein LOC120908507 isoform X1 n=1 Tax=Anopheles arabiensis TaxID=7173 RepID=UPI001AACDE0E|nr:uncharacterized protein LOC120908507 isoform X1 [Anopheles arabiensis]
MKIEEPDVAVPDSTIPQEAIEQAAVSDISGNVENEEEHGSGEENQSFAECVEEPIHQAPIHQHSFERYRQNLNAFQIRTIFRILEIKRRNVCSLCCGFRKQQKKLASKASCCGNRKYSLKPQKDLLEEGNKSSPMEAPTRQRKIHTERLMLAMILQIHYVTECRALPRNVAPLCKRNNQNPTSSSNFVPQKQHNCQLNAYKFDRERTRTHTATETSAVW